MDLRRLSHVVALADTLHFARAAEQVHLSQPAFSRSIQAIEDDLGAPRPLANSSSSGRANCCSRRAACSVTSICTATASWATRPSAWAPC
jgi:hypothetical protein